MSSRGDIKCVVVVPRELHEDISWRRAFRPLMLAAGADRLTTSLVALFSCLNDYVKIFMDSGKRVWVGIRLTITTRSSLEPVD
jgi:hypothetical protein